jgi:hypothetical protein
MSLNAGVSANWHNLRIMSLYSIITLAYYHICSSGLNRTTYEQAVSTNRILIFLYVL